MSQFPHDNYLQDFSEEMLPDGAQPFDPKWHHNSSSSSSSDDDTAATYSDDPPEVKTASDFSDIVFTNTAEMRTVLASITKYTTGRLGHYLRNYKGLLILPLEALSAIRSPLSHHTGVFPVIIFVPHQRIENYQDNLPNLVESINVLYKDKK